MAVLTAYSDLYPLMTPELPGCPEPFILQALKKSLRKFCQDSDAWREQLASIDLKDGILDYSLVSAVDAEIRHVVEVRIGAEIVDLAGADVVTTAAIGATTFNVHGIASVTGTIASGDQFIISGNDGTLYTLSADAVITAHTATLVFTPALTAEATAGDKLAVVPQKDLGTLISPDLYVYRAEATTRLGVAQARGTLSLDASLEPTEDLVRGLDVKVSLVPHVNSDAVDLDFLTRWAEAVSGGALFSLMTMKGRKWTDAGRAALFLLDYNKGLSRARRETAEGYKTESEGLSA
ncbi:MAG: hypothetical protein WC497_05595 [Patescibacteria group bacterium]